MTSTEQVITEATALVAQSPEGMRYGALHKDDLFA